MNTDEAPYKPYKKKYSRSKTKKEKIKSGRKCLICGCDPYPNMFYCKKCHRNTNDEDADECRVNYN